LAALVHVLIFVRHFVVVLIIVIVRLFLAGSSQLGTDDETQNCLWNL